ncbi:hypothetical protein [Mycobacteroides abscessus]|uniref:hypothetical protein n=1 Tax=Mycobacteroides abscessus TaxID=36809 RepID=UPI001041CF41|nr:hypothetical protein [Mycobacteroides abscessus]
MGSVGQSYLAARFWRLARRIGKTKAALAVAHSIRTISWHLLHDGTTYTPIWAATGSYAAATTAPIAATDSSANSKASIPSPLGESGLRTPS